MLVSSDLSLSSLNGVLVLEPEDHVKKLIDDPVLGREQIVGERVANCLILSLVSHVDLIAVEF